ncbi:hypothetical protein [Paracoccus sp. ME4]|uniref:hypothetical protein n=1 Tax=Paracoccus sp. ME4 TaxID=3138066 RepID=UPI00398B4F88
MLEAPVPLKDWPNDDQTSRVVLIARDLTAEHLADSLELPKLKPSTARLARRGGRAVAAYDPIAPCAKNLASRSRR